LEGAFTQLLGWKGGAPPGIYQKKSYQVRLNTCMGLTFLQSASLSTKVAENNAI